MSWDPTTVSTLILVVGALVVGAFVFFGRWFPKPVPATTSPTTGTTPATTGTTPATSTTPATGATPSGASASTKKKLWQQWWFWMILILLAIPVAYLAYSAIVPMMTTSKPSTPHFSWPTPLGFFLAAVLIILSLLLPKDIKRVVLVVGLCIGLFTFAVSGFGSWAAKNVTNAEDCAAYGDCGPRAGDFSTVNGGTVEVPVGGSITFWAIGKVELQNRLGYYLNVSPAKPSEVTWTVDARVYYFKSNDGGKRLLTVTSIASEDR